MKKQRTSRLSLFAAVSLLAAGSLFAGSTLTACASGTEAQNPDSTGRLYRMNPDGSDAEPLCTLDGVDLSVCTQLFLGYADGKLALAFMDEVQNDFYDSGYDYNTSSDIIIVDTTDGTWRFSEDET